ncbi:uncharacterized protein LOC143178890 [Calliopsis andreniformis]|uniref:uncharacterized protein LOC143178890 n=1 Tax=Calliopsis andreniformis TaxID=337506 RepID=UPI003FCDC332
MRLISLCMHRWPFHQLNPNYESYANGMKYPGETPNELYHIKLSVIDQNQCLSASFRVTNDNICTLNKRGEGACHVSAFMSSRVLEKRRALSCQKIPQLKRHLFFFLICSSSQKPR